MTHTCAVSRRYPYGVSSSTHCAKHYYVPVSRVRSLIINTTVKHKQSVFDKVVSRDISEGLETFRFVFFFF